MKKLFCFYCYDDDPVARPEEKITFAVGTTAEFYCLGNISKIQGDLESEFRKELIKIEVECFGQGEVKARNIPAIQRFLNKHGWEEKYIPFGP